MSKWVFYSPRIQGQIQGSTSDVGVGGGHKYKTLFLKTNLQFIVLFFNSETSDKQKKYI